MYRSFFPIIIRLLVGQIWTAVLMMTGGYFMSILFRCVFGSAWHDLTNTIPKSVGVTVQQLVGYIIFALVTAPLLCLRPRHMRRLYTIKSVVLPPIAIALFAFCIVQGRNASGSAGFFKAPSRRRATPPSLGPCSPPSILHGQDLEHRRQPNGPRALRRTPNTPFLSQLISLPIGNTLCAALGIFATSATQCAWGVTLWNPRTAIALASCGWVLSIFASCMGVDAFPFGIDVTAFFPRWLNIRRGMFVCYAIGLLIFSWKILKSSTTFLRFLRGYSIFLAPLVGIYITDYFVVRKGNLWAADLYKAERGARYWYTWGVNWRNVAAFIVTVVLLIPGFAAQCGEKVRVRWERVYSLGWVLGCTISSVVYFGLCMLGDFCKEERGMKFEESYEVPGMFLGDGAGAVEGVEVGAKEQEGEKRIGESKVREV